MLQALGISTDSIAVYQAMLDQPGHGVTQIAEATGLAPTQCTKVSTNSGS